MSLENPPKFIKDFSKEQSQAERDQAAAEIRAKRTEYFAGKKSTESKEQEKSQILSEIAELQGQMEEYNGGSFLSKVKDFFAIKKVERELQAKLGQQSSIEDELSKSISGRADLDEARTMIYDFYAREKKKWAETPYSKEDITQYFTEEHLASLSMEDYILLLRRFPGEMMTHVTRQGIRDHAGLGNHQAGLGKHHDTFNIILREKKLQSAMGIRLQESSKEEAVAKFLGLDSCSSRQEALRRINGKFSSAIIGDPRAFADASAVHLATEKVADSFYGSERGNEIFFAFPSAQIASQYEFSGSLSSAPSNLSQNDQFVWPDIEKGLPINTGIVFIPEDAMVSPEHGSKYELDKDKKPILSQGIQEILDARFGEKPGFIQVFIQQSYKIKKLLEQGDEAGVEAKFDEFGIKDKGARKILLDDSFLDEVARIWGRENEESDYKEILIKFFIGNKLDTYKLAQDAVTSKEYWDKYFQENPELSPVRIVYYSGGDPTRALDEWREKNGITKRDNRGNLGFSEHEASRDVKNKDETQQRFVSIARKLVDERFPSEEKVPTYEVAWQD